MEKIFFSEEGLTRAFPKRTRKKLPIKNAYKQVFKSIHIFILCICFPTEESPRKGMSQPPNLSDINLGNNISIAPAQRPATHVHVNTEVPSSPQTTFSNFDINMHDNMQDSVYNNVHALAPAFP